MKVFAPRPWRKGVTVLLLSCGLSFTGLRAEEVRSPVVVGALANRFGAADVAALVSLAQQASTEPVGQPMLIQTEETHQKDRSSRPWSAAIYFAPKETSSQCWRGFYLTCYWEQSLSPEQREGNRVAGNWSVDAKFGIPEYLVLPTQDKPVPTWPVDDPQRSRYTFLHSSLPTGQLMEFIDTARGYSTAAKDGSEFKLSDHFVREVYTGTDKDGQTTGSITVYIPEGQLKSRNPMNVRAVRDPKHGWRIVKIDQYIYW